MTDELPLRPATAEELEETLTFALRRVTRDLLPEPDFFVPRSLRRSASYTISLPARMARLAKRWQEPLDALLAKTNSLALEHREC
jgi:hypothetical protein